MLSNTDILVTATRCTPTTAALWLPSLQAAAARFNINTPQAMAAWLANVGVESQSLTVFQENMNYSAQGLSNTWPGRYAVDPKALKKTPNTLALALAYKPQDIANNVYANRMGNGDVQSGDGWKYRGQGPIQITGRAMAVSLQSALTMEFVNHPELLQDPQAGSLSAAWFFATHNCIEYANEGNFAAVVKAINGAPPSDANNGPLREARYKTALAAISALRTSVPVPTPAPPST